MKKVILKLAGIFSVIFILGISACEEPVPSAEEAFLEKLSGEWSATTVSVDDVVLQGAFDGFEINFTTGKTYTTANGNAPIWPATGSFSTKASTSTVGFDIVRTDGVEV